MLSFDLTLRYTMLQELMINYYATQHIRTCFERTPCIKQTLMEFQGCPLNIHVGFTVST